MSTSSFSSKLCEQDIHFFLEEHGFTECELLDSYSPAYSNEVVQYFMFDGNEYTLTYSDISVALERYPEENMNQYEKPFSADDWFCFLKSKFGNDFVKYYAELYNASNIVCEQPRFIQKIPVEEFREIVRIILRKNRKHGVPFDVDDKNVVIWELKSFYMSERRFLVRHLEKSLYFFIRFSDFEVISHCALGDSFYCAMVGRFGNEYKDAYEKYFNSISQGDETQTWAERFQNIINKLLDK